MNITIRPYAPSKHDMAGIKEVCCRAGFLGDPIDPVFNDTAWFADFMITPYLVFEPECAWVAEVDGRVAGYLTGSKTGLFGLLRAQFGIVKVMQLYWQYVFGKYRDHPRSRDFAGFILTEALLHVPRHPADTPHFHFNVDRAYRGMGTGNRLLARFEETLRAEGMNRYYAEVLASPATRCEKDFIRMGYAVFDRKPTTVFYPEVGELEVLCVVRDLAPSIEGGK